MTFSRYLKVAAFDFVLVLICTWSLESVLFDVFFTPATLQYGPIPFGISTVLLLALFGAAYRRDLFLKMGILYIVLVAGIVCAAIAVTGNGHWLADQDDNWFFGIITIVLSTTLGFLLTRTRPGSAIWFIVAIFACALVQFFYLRYEFVYSLLVLFSALALIVYRNCQINVFKSDTIKQVSFPANFATATVSVLLTMLIAVGVWFVIIAPLDPQALQLKLIVQLEKPNILEYKGTGSFFLTPDTNLTSTDLKDDGYYTTDDLSVGSGDKRIPARSQQTEQSQQQQNESGGIFDIFNQNSNDSEFNPFSYELPPTLVYTVLIVILLIIAAAVAYFLLRRRWRRRRLDQISKLPLEEQVSILYLFLLSRLERLGFSVPSGMTLSEYAQSAEASMGAITHETQVAFSTITTTYVHMAYGHVPIREDDVAPFVAFYRNFWKGARRHLGNFRYLLRSFRL